jgi:hypothetical protein
MLRIYTLRGLVGSDLGTYPLTSLMTNKEQLEGLQGEGARGFYIAQHFLPHPIQSSATFAQADPKEWAQIRSTVRNSCFVTRFPFFAAFPRFEFIVRSSCFRVSFNVSFPSFRFRDLVPFRLRCGWT